MRTRGLLSSAPALAAVACVLLCGGTSAAHAGQTPQPGSTTTTTCRFVPSEGSTVCVRETVVTRDGGCEQPGERLTFEEHVDSARTYRGDVVLPGATGVRPDAVLLDDSGPHAYGSGRLVADSSCG